MQFKLFLEFGVRTSIAFWLCNTFLPPQHEINIDDQIGNWSPSKDLEHKWTQHVNFVEVLRLKSAKDAKSVLWPNKFVGAELHVLWIELRISSQEGVIVPFTLVIPGSNGKSSSKRISTTPWQKKVPQNGGNKVSNVHKQNGRLTRTCLIFHLNYKWYLYHQFAVWTSSKGQNRIFFKAHLVSAVVKETKSSDAMHIDWYSNIKSFCRIIMIDWYWSIEYLDWFKHCHCSCRTKLITYHSER